MREKTKLCKYCKEEIKKHANTCPHCGKYQGLSNSTGCGIILLIIIFVFSVRACSDVDDTDSESSSASAEYITYDEFNSIKTGMTYDEVCEIVGSVGEISAQSDVGGTSVTIITWYGDSWSGANAAIYFENGTVTSKSQVGLN